MLSNCSWLDSTLLFYHLLYLNYFTCLSLSTVYKFHSPRICTPVLWGIWLKLPHNLTFCTQRTFSHLCASIFTISLHLPCIVPTLLAASVKLCAWQRGRVSFILVEESSGWIIVSCLFYYIWKEENLYLWKFASCLIHLGYSHHLVD